MKKSIAVFGVLSLLLVLSVCIPTNSAQAGDRKVKVYITPFGLQLVTVKKTHHYHDNHDYYGRWNRRYHGISNDVVVKVPRYDRRHIRFRTTTDNVTYDNEYMGKLPPYYYTGRTSHRRNPTVDSNYMGRPSPYYCTGRTCN